MQPLPFCRLMRKRREAVPYLRAMIGTAHAKGHLTLAEQAARPALELMPSWKLRKLLVQVDPAKAR